MSCGAPVIASDIPVVREVTGAAAVRVPPLDVQKLAESLVEILGDEGKRAYFSEAGMDWARRFTWEKTAQLTLDVYRDVLASTNKKHKQLS
jgi:glycosyltransferase involved in cell wall biosynthesis